MSDNFLSVGLSDSDLEAVLDFESGSSSRKEPAAESFLTRLELVNSRTESVYSRMESVYSRMESLDKLVPMVEKVLSEQEVSKGQVLAAVASVNSKVEAFDKRLIEQEEKVADLVQRVVSVDSRLESVDSRVDSRVQTLETQLQELLRWKEDMAQKVAFTEQAMHDPYSAAFSKSEDFTKVFFFMIFFGYDTVNGITCAVFRNIGGNPCVCINFRALSVIAKAYLSSAKVSKMGLFPAFSLFRLNNLQRLFREAHLPEHTVKKEFLMDLFKKSAVKQLKTAAANLTNWIALDMKAFVAGVRVFKRDPKFKELKQVFSDHFPKDEEGNFALQKKITDKDNVFVRDGEEEPDEENKPIFCVPYWNELFYEGMKEYRALLHPTADTQDHQHFGNFYLIGPLEQFPILEYEDALNAGPSMEPAPIPALKVSKKRSADDAPTPKAREAREARGPAEKRPRHRL
jgi:hypothetical protein